MIQKVRRGDPFRVKASDWNQMADFINGRNAPPSSVQGVFGTGSVIVRNYSTVLSQSGDTLNRFSFVKPVGFDLFPSSEMQNELSKYSDFADHPVLKVEIPAADEDCPLLCLDQPLSLYEYGSARAFGVCTAYFSSVATMSSNQHLNRYAVPDGMGGLKTAIAGSTRVLRVMTSGNIKWGYVILGGGASRDIGAFDVIMEEGNVKVFDSSNPNGSTAGIVYSGNQTYYINRVTLTPMVGWVYIDVDYANGTRVISIAASLPALGTSERRWIYALASVTQDSSGNYEVHRMNMPGNIQVSGRWV